MSDEQVKTLPRIGEAAPDFEAASSRGPVKLADYNGKWLMLFSHPADFTPVCTTEISTFARRYGEFQARGVELLGISVDSVQSHIAWTHDMAQLGTPIPFPIVADLDMAVSRRYGMLHPGESVTATVRAVFFIDPKGVVRALLYYPMSLGRSVDELLRVFDGLQTADRLGVSTPVDWKPGDDVVIPPPKSVSEIETAEEAKAKGYTYHTWYLRTKPQG
jgi:peroxiredoxin 2/4